MKIGRNLARLSTLLGPLLLAACGGESGGGGSAMNTASMPPFCQNALASVDAFMSSVANQRTTGPEYGGTAVVGVISDIVDGMNAFVAVDHSAAQHQTYVNLMTLVQYDSEFRPEPYLAERWEESEDGKEITFFLRQDVLWHDGTPTTAHDVAFTFRRATDPETMFPNETFWAQYDQTAEGVEVIDDYTIRFRLEPHLSYMDGWRATGIMPAHLLNDVPAAELKGHPFGEQCPVGNGPFVFAGNMNGDRWSFQANPVFPEGLGGQPRLDRYVYRVIPDQGTLMSELLAGGLDIYIQPLTEQANQIKEEAELELLTFPFRNYAMVIWNRRKPTLADKRVRQALTLATDRQQMLRVLRGGYGRLANATVPPFHWSYDPSIEGRMAYNPGEAARLLGEAGWTDRDGDGFRENDNGDPLEISIAYNTGNKERQDIAEIMQAQLGHVGVRVRVESVDWPSLLARLTSPERDFDGATLAWVTDFSVDDSGLFRSDNISEPYAFAGTDSPELDELIRAIPVTNDRAALGPLLGEYQDAIIDEQPFTFLYYADRLAGVNRRMRGVEMDVRGEWVNLRSWWIPESERKYMMDQ